MFFNFAKLFHRTLQIKLQLDFCKLAIFRIIKENNHIVFKNCTTICHILKKSQDFGGGVAILQPHPPPAFFIFLDYFKVWKKCIKMIKVLPGWNHGISSRYSCCSSTTVESIIIIFIFKTNKIIKEDVTRNACV